MKQLFSLFLVLVMVLTLLAGCKENPAVQETSIPTLIAQQTQPTAACPFTEPLAWRIM